MGAGPHSWRVAPGLETRRELAEDEMARRASRIRVLIVMFAVLYAVAIGGTVWAALRVFQGW